MATSFIGKAISLLSISDVRYRGILAGLDPENSTIQLQNVYSMGTENRRPVAEFIPPAEQPYQYIIFRASEVKDIALDNPVTPVVTRSVHDDPAVIGASAPPMANGSNGAYGQYPSASPAEAAPAPQPVPATLGSRPAPSSTPASAPSHVNGEQPTPHHPPQGNGRSSTSGRRVNSNSVSNAAASLEKVERALGDLRLATAQSQSQTPTTSNGSRGGRKNGGGRQQHVEIKVPTTDFDFASANARFKKTPPAEEQKGDESDEHTNPSDDEGDQRSKASSKAQKDPAYNPRVSFFDTLSSSASAAPPEIKSERGGRGKRGMGKSRREEEREKNVATFGEPGGVGLLGPGAYVGGYGGYGRRGGGRGGRRGGGRRPAAGAD